MHACVHDVRGPAVRGHGTALVRMVATRERGDRARIFL